MENSDLIGHCGVDWWYQSISC